jgi:hypothetical protein
MNMCSIEVAFFQLLIFGRQTVTSVLKTNNTNIVGDGNRRVLWHCMKIIVSFIRHLTSIKVLSLAKLKLEHCSEQYKARHVFIAINCYREQE